jgi:hypothetical protein
MVTSSSSRGPALASSVMNMAASGLQSLHRQDQSNSRATLESSGSPRAFRAQGSLIEPGLSQGNAD